MMKYFYSPSLNAFLDGEIIDTYKLAGSWPDDVREVGDDKFKEFTSTPPQGKVRAAGEDGCPTWVDVPPPTAEEIKRDADAKKAELLVYAGTVMAPLQDAVDLGMATEDEESSLLAWKKYRVLVNRVDTANPPINWPEHPK